MLQQACKSEHCNLSHGCCDEPTGDTAYENLAENDDIFSDWRNITTEQTHYKKDTDAFVKCLDAVSSKAKKKPCREANEKCTVVALAYDAGDEAQDETNHDIRKNKLWVLEKIFACCKRK